MQSHCQGLHEGGEFKGQTLGDGQQIRNRQVDELAKEPRMSGRAEEADIRANVVAAAPAEFTVIAVESRLQRCAVPRRPAGNSQAGLDYGTGRFVTEHHGVLARRIAHRAFRIGMQVGSADAGGVNPHLHFTRTGVFDFSLRQAEFPRRDQFGNEHEFNQAATGRIGRR